MLAYPQLSTGAQAQYPITRRRLLRTVVNRAADQRAIKLSDLAGGITEWTLEYAGLNDGEAAALRAFFDQTEGSLQSFTFLDPTANLLAWSDQLTNAAWTVAPLLSLDANLVDPFNGTKAWRLTNPSGGAQSIVQTLQVPGGYTYCVSLYAKSAPPVTASLLLGAAHAPRTIPADWTRIQYKGSGASGAESLDFGFEVPAGAVIEVFGIQVEAQPAASHYHPSILGGVYPDARFSSDTLAITATSLGQHACTVKIIHADHL